MSALPIIFINLLGLILVLFSYIYYIPKIGISKLWVGISENVRYMYMISIILCVLLYTIQFVVICNDPSKISNVYYLGLVLFLISAALWTPSIYYKFNPYITILLLSLTSFGVLLMLISSFDVLIKICLLYLFLHCLILDNIYWSSKYLKY
jgi:hypothetical protein